MDGKIQLKLVRDQYIEYIKEDLDISTVGRSFNANLQKAYIAYLDIEVTPSNHAKIYIDGVYLKDEKIPISKYAVPAGKDVVVRAIHSLTGESITRTVKLREDERQFLRLNFTGARTPTSK
jgi:hypothetical protein